MTWQSFKQALAYPVLVPCPGGHRGGHPLYLLFWHHRHLLGGDRRIHPLGWSAAATAGRPQRTVGYYQLIHLEGTPLTRIDGRMIIGMFGGCLAAALWANNVKLRFPRSRIRIVQAVAGGIIAGFGARLAMGCNLAAFFTGIPQFSCTPGCLPSPPPSAPGLAPASRCCPLFRIPVKMQKVSAASPLTQKPQQARRRFRLGMVIFFAMIGWGLLTAADHPALGLAMLFGIGFGLLIERAQICFTSAFRDMWITGRTVMAKAIIFGTWRRAPSVSSAMCNWGWRRKLCGPVPMRRLAGCCLALASCWPAAVKPAGCTGRWRARFTTGGLGWAMSLAQRCSPGAGTISPLRSPPTGRKSTC